MHNNNDRSKAMVLMVVVLFLAGLACGSSGGSGGAGNVQQNQPSVNTQQDQPPAIEQEPEEVPPVSETDPNEIEPTTLPAEPDEASLANAPFLMPIEDIFSIRGRGTVIVGTVLRGTLELESEVEIVGVNETVGRYVVTGIEQFSKIQEEALPGQQVGVLLRGVSTDDLHIGQVAAAPGSMTAHYEFSAAIYLLSEAEGGPNRPVFNGYRPQFHIWTLDVTGAITLPDGVEQLLPGQEANVTIELIYPAALEPGTAFDLMDNDQLIGTGVVTEIIR